MIVRIPRLPNLPSSSKAKGLKKTRKRALARAHTNISSLREEVKKLHKRIKTKNKQIERLTKKTKRSQNVNSSELTPRKQTEMEVEKLHLTPKRSRFVRRKLLVSNALLSELKTTRKLHSAKKRRILYQIVSGGITKKYRCLNKLNTYTGLSRRSMSKVVGKQLVNMKEKMKCISRLITDSVHTFYTRDDNSRVQPGKADKKWREGTNTCTD